MVILQYFKFNHKSWYNTYKRGVRMMEKDILNQILDELKSLRLGQEDLKLGQKRLEDKLGNLATETSSHFKHLESKLDQQQKTFEVVGSELKNVKIDIEFLSEKTGKHDTELNSLNKRIQS